MYYLCKSEPSDYSIRDFERDKITLWDGVENNMALKYLRQIKIGDLCFIYHTGDEKKIVGLGKAIKHATQDKLAVFEIKYATTYSKTLSLAAMKADSGFEGFELLKNARLSVMPVPDEFAKLILERVQ